MASTASRDLLQASGGIVLAGRIELIKHVVRVGRREARLDLVVVPAVRGVAGRPGLVPLEGAARHHHEDIQRADEALPRLLLVFAAIPRRIVGDAFHDHGPHHTVAAGNRRGRARQRYQAVSEIGIHLAPHPAVHRAHRRAHHQSKVIRLEPFGEQLILRTDHVVVRVFREARVQAVAWLTRLAVSDSVRENDEISGRVQQLSGTEQLAAEGLTEKRGACPACAVQNHHRVLNDTGSVAARRPECPVMQRQRRQRLAGPEPEVARDEIAFNRRRKLRRLLRAG